MGLFDKIFGPRRKTGLKNAKVEKLNPNDIWFALPTISNEYPITAPSTFQTEYDLYLHEDDYRQNEFLNRSALSLIEQEFSGVKNIWKSFSEKSGEYTLFKNCHVRSAIGDPNLQIQFSELSKLLNVNKIGSVKINNETLVNGFTFKTLNTSYYGIKIDDSVRELCISQWNENTINEIYNINSIFNLVFVSWYNADLIEENAKR